MGQRHQIYLRLPNKSVVGIHHQWLYGKTALKLLNNYLSFIRKIEVDDKFYAKSPRKECYTRSYYAQQMAAACYSLIHEEGYFHEVHTDLEVECEDPRLGDNNDGITIIDLSDNRPKYCFMSLHGLEVSKDDLPLLTPITAREYVTSYYPLWSKNKIVDRDGDTVDANDLKEEVQKLLTALSQYQVLTLKEVKNIFPKMFKKLKIKETV